MEQQSRVGCWFCGDGTTQIYNASRQCVLGSSDERSQDTQKGVCFGIPTWCLSPLYLECKTFLFAHRKHRNGEHELSHADVWATTAMLIVQPRHYSTWNVRKRLIAHSLISLEEDLHFTSLVLHTHPKKHECWSHRLWVFEKALESSGNVPGVRNRLLCCELDLCASLADKALRNFYAWQHCHRVSAEMINCSDEGWVNRNMQAMLTASKTWLTKHPSDFTSMIHRSMLLSSFWDLSGVISSELASEVTNNSHFPCLRNVLPNSIDQKCRSNASASDHKQIRDEICWVHERLLLYPEFESFWVYLRFLNVAMFVTFCRGNSTCMATKMGKWLDTFCANDIPFYCHFAKTLVPLSADMMHSHGHSASRQKELATSSTREVKHATSSIMWTIHKILQLSGKGRVEDEDSLYGLRLFFMKMLQELQTQDAPRQEMYKHFVDVAGTVSRLGIPACYDSQQ